MVCICLELNIARSPLGPVGKIFWDKNCRKPDTAVVVLVVEVLDAFKVERLDDPLEAKVKLGASTGGHHRGAVIAVDLGWCWRNIGFSNLCDPKTKLVGDIFGDGGDGEVNVLEANLEFECVHKKKSEQC